MRKATAFRGRSEQDRSALCPACCAMILETFRWNVSNGVFLDINRRTRHAVSLQDARNTSPAALSWSSLIRQRLQNRSVSAQQFLLIVCDDCRNASSPANPMFHVKQFRLSTTTAAVARRCPERELLPIVPIILRALRRSPASAGSPPAARSVRSPGLLPVLRILPALRLLPVFRPAQPRCG